MVKSSVGHIRDLPKSGSDEKTEKAKPISTKGLTAAEKAKIKAEKERVALVKRMGIDPYNGWKANYQIMPDKEKVVSELKSLAKKADHIYLATDLDREGEAIAWHLREIIGVMTAVLAEWYLMKSPKMRSKRLLTIRNRSILTV